MKFDIVKEKLHDYIEHGDHDKIMAIYMLLNDEITTGSVAYDEATMAILEARSNEMSTGKVKTYTLEQTIENLRKSRSA